MFQEFFTDTLGSRFIKSLLQETPIPIFNSVVDGDILVSGVYYIYKDFVIQCNTGGILRVDSQETLYPSSILYPSKFLFPTYGYRSATFYVRSLIDENNSKIMRAYKSKSNYYDSETHRYLGKYLRYIRTRTGLNLLPYYNCYNHKSIPDIQLFLTDPEKQDYVSSTTKIYATTVSKQQYKVVAVPILFGKKYKIAVDCSSQVLMRSVIYSSVLNYEYTELLQGTEKIYSALDFMHPVTYSVETSDPTLYSQERNLYLIIQLPQNNDSSIVVLENFDMRQGVYCDEDSVRVFDFINPSLLYMNTTKSYAFSDRLIEYLLDNVVCSVDLISQNVSKIQMAISKIPPQTTNKYGKALDNGYATLGIWDEAIPKTVLRLVNDYSKTHFILDQDGNINKDVEKLILTKGVSY